MKLLSIILVVAGFHTIPAIADEPADLTRFLQDGANAGFIAAAITTLDDCDVPLSFTQSRDVESKGRIVLSIGCAEPSNEHAMLLFFNEYEDGTKLWFEEIMLIP